MTEREELQANLDKAQAALNEYYGNNQQRYGGHQLGSLDNLTREELGAYLDKARAALDKYNYEFDCHFRDLIKF